MDGPGRCAGRVEIWYGGVWNRIKEQGWTDDNSDTVCNQLNCGAKRKLASDDKFSQGSSVFLPKAISCQPSASKISKCDSVESNSPQGDSKAVAITCQGKCFPFVHLVTLTFPCCACV